MNGTIYLIGAGPGSADFLTLKAARLLGEADVVLYDALVCDDVLALAVRARKICVGKRSGRASTEQGFINRLLVASAKSARVVVRLKGGDPMVFGRAQEEIAACLAAKLNVEVVPGVSAGMAAAAHVQTSLTRRGISKSLAFVTPASAIAAQGDEAWADAAASAQTSVIYMGVGQAGGVRDTLLARGLSPTLPVVIVQNAGRPGTHHVAGILADLVILAQSVGDDGPSILMFGEVFAELAQADSDLRHPIAPVARLIGV
ncbi:MAG: Siroheme synthase [Pseudomonadota bacterium]|jgi:uroporphyrin-III C-methyltransferase